MKVHQLLLGASLLSLTLFAGGALAQETPETPSSPGAAISQAARQGGGRAIADVARENAPGTARSAEARAAAGGPDTEEEDASENSGIGGAVSAFAKDAQGEGVSDFALENSPGIDKANEVRANLPPASVPAAVPTLPPTARATLPTRPARPQLPTVPPRH
jgi:hypothetical protein